MSGTIPWHETPAAGPSLKAQKRDLDAKLHQMVCDKTLKLKDAIKKDRVKAYNQYVKGAK